MHVEVFGDVAVVRHQRSTHVAALTARLTLARRDPWRSVLASPLLDAPALAPDGSPVTLWPRLDALDPAGAVPWADAGALLARLHRLPVPTDPALGPHAGRALLEQTRTKAAALKPGGSTDVLRILIDELLAAWPTPDPARVTLVQGDWHLGQIGRIPGTDTLVLHHSGSLGVGDPAWDLARPAALWALGLTEDAGWQTFLAAYSAAGGPAPVPGRAWHALDHPARCAVARLAVDEIARDETSLSPVAETLLSAAVKMVGWR